MEMMKKLHSLYFDATVTESQPIDTFYGINGFVPAVLYKDGVAGPSLCDAYPKSNFFNHQYVMAAIATRNNTFMNGKVQQDHDARRSESANVFVKNLNSSIDNMKLQAIFAKYGNILSSKIQVCENGKSKGYGYVQFETPESAQNAIEELNGQDIEGKEIYVGHFKKKEERFQADVGYTNLYVKNLDQNVTEETLDNKFSGFGNIISLVISRDSDGISKGFGFVNFEKPEDAKKAKESLDGTQLGSKVLYVARAQKKEEREQKLQLQLQERQKGFNVYVKNINEDVDDEELKIYFEQCGEVKAVKIMRDKLGFSRGFGCVCFSKPQEAERAIRIFNGVSFHKRLLPQYNLDLRSISVGGQVLSIDPSVFSTSSNQGTIVDSGTTLAYLADEAYDAFR
ncbi:hypothetical protein REPUB_Repub11eG0142900 [Reevesia pubescens]